MVQYQETIWCDGCGVEILWPPLQSDHGQYCCVDCKEGFGCDCGDVPEDEYREEGTSLISLYT